MKKIIIVLFILILVILAGLAIFIATFDINRYNRALASKIESFVGNPVEIGRISLGWKGKLSLGVEKFHVFVQENGQKNLELSFEKADVALELLPLLKREVKVSSISINQPKIHLVRLKEGTITVRGYSPKGITATIARAKPAAAVAINFNISSITMRDGTLRFEDFTGPVPADIVIDDFDADIKNVSLSTPVEFAVKMALLASKQNVDISGTAGPFNAGILYAKDLNANVDLGTIDYSKLMKAVPAAQTIGIKEGFSGILNAKVREFQLAGNKIEKLSSDITFTNGKLSLEQLKAPVDNVSLSASIEQDKLSVKSFSGTLANATLKSSGEITNIFGVPSSNLNVEVGIPEVRQFLASLLGGKQYLDGKMTFSTKASLSGTTPDAIKQTLSASGTFTIDNGVLLDTNLLKESLGKLSMFPGFIDTLNDFLPQSLKDSLEREYTLLKPINQSFTLKDQNVSFDDLKFETDFASVKGTANMTLQGELVGSGTISFTPELSSAMIKAASQMSYLTNQENVIEFPITFKVSGAGASVIPDLEYIGKRALMKKGEEVVTDLLNKAIGKTQESQPSDSGQAGSSIFDIIKDVASKDQTQGK